MFLRRYDGDHDGRLRFSDFCTAFVPNDVNAAEMLQSRPAYHIYHAWGREKYFSGACRDQIVKTWQAHFDAENEAERLRDRLSNRPGFTLHEAFKTLDKKGRGYLTREDLEWKLEQHGFSPLEAEMQLLMQRYDKNRNGRITYTEFVDELTLKSKTL